jgi:hypothetical protein
LKKDISESNDVAAQNPKVVAAIEEIMRSQHSSSADFPFKPID